MCRQATRWGLVVLVLLTGFMSVRAEPAQQQKLVQITSPEINAELRGVVQIRGSASVPSFQFYKVEFGVGPSPDKWALIGSMHDRPVLNDQLEVWDTTRWPDGVYSLRLQAVKQDGNYEEFYVRGLTIANARPTSTPTATTPTATPTLEGIQAPTPTSELTPMSTATLQIITPTAALSMPSPTPTLSRPRQRESFKVDTKGWGQSFCYGAAAMGLVFALLGIVFGLRRLL